MSAISSIEWTDRTWNPVTGCTKVSQGCKHCYAEGVAARFFGTQYRPVMTSDPTKTIDTVSTSHHEDMLSIGTARPRRFTDVQTHKERLSDPFSWGKRRALNDPLKVFVNSMSDLFHEDVSYDFVDRVFAVMALTPHIVYQVLTKRPERMRAYLTWTGRRDKVADAILDMPPRPTREAAAMLVRQGVAIGNGQPKARWPLPNVWLGVSVEDQTTADARIPLLLQTKARIRFVSYEPALGPVDFGRWTTPQGVPGQCFSIDGEQWHDFGDCPNCIPALDWVIVGGESGHGARPFNIAWARRTVERCRAAGVAVFVKQVGAVPVSPRGLDAQWPTGTKLGAEFVTDDEFNGRHVTLRDRKGGDPAEWPDDLRVREFPR